MHAALSSFSDSTASAMRAGKVRGALAWMSIVIAMLFAVLPLGLDASVAHGSAFSPSNNHVSLQLRKSAVADMEEASASAGDALQPLPIIAVLPIGHGWQEARHIGLPTITGSATRSFPLPDSRPNGVANPRAPPLR